jgi:hypothetical protein
VSACQPLVAHFFRPRPALHRPDFSGLFFAIFHAKSRFFLSIAGIPDALASSFHAMRLAMFPHKSSLY